MSKTGLIISHEGDVTIVDFRNVAVLDAAGVEDVTGRLYELADRQRRTRILLDLSAVRFLASQMLGSLVALHKKVCDLGGKVVLCGLAENLHRVFEVSSLDRVLAFAPDVAAGRQMLDAPAGAADQSKAPVGAGFRRGWQQVVNKQIRIFFAGALILVPLSITAWVVWSLGTWLDGLGRRAFEGVGSGIKLPHGIGALVLVGVIYVFGLLTHLWLFRGFFGLVERLVTHVPGVKTVYESVRDLMNLFGGKSSRMGRVVQYNMPDTDMAFMGILTNENPLGLADDNPNRKVAVYMPLSYMIGGPTMLVSPRDIVEVDMSVEQCMKLCATAQVGSRPGVRPQGKPAAPAE